MAGFAVIEEDATAGADPQELVNIFSVGGASRGYIYDFVVSSGATPDDQAANYDVGAFELIAAAVETITVDKWHPEMQRPYIEEPEIVAY